MHNSQEEFGIALSVTAAPALVDKLNPSNPPGPPSSLQSDLVIDN